jgi:hypothetical protein
LVRRVLLAVLVAMLSVSASGVSVMIVGEPCQSSEAGSSRDDGDCPPTCATCGCCAQAVEPVVLTIPVSSEFIVTHLHPIIPRLPKSEGRDIFHVPKARPA